MAPRKRTSTINTDTYWHLDRKIPIALIITLMLQMGATIWWAAGLNSSLVVLKEEVRNIETSMGKMADKQDRLISLQTDVKHISNRLHRIESDIDRLESYAREKSGKR